MSDAQVIVRQAKPNDKDFVMDSWIRGQYHGSPYWSQMPKDLFYKHYSKHINKILAIPQTGIYIAVLAEDPDMILGFIVMTLNTLHWAYTKNDYRGQGIQRLLTKGLPITTVSSTTLPGASITKKKKLIFNPFIGEQYE